MLGAVQLLLVTRNTLSYRMQSGHSLLTVDQAIGSHQKKIHNTDYAQATLTWL